MELILGLICSFIAVTVIGHGIWVVLGAIFSLVRKPDQIPPRDIRPKHCPRCDGLIVAGQCEICRWPQQVNAVDGTRRVLAETIQRLQAYRQLGLVDESLAQRWNAALSSELLHYIEPSSSDAAIVAQLAPVPDPLNPLAAAPTNQPLSETPIDAQAVTFPQWEVVDESGASLPTDAEVIDPADRQAAPLPLEERARQYAAAREQARQSAESAIAPVAAAPSKPRRAFSDVMLAFMEQRHIRWGELVGGLLIICCSIALVISFWSEISERPFLKFFVFNGTTGALFALGLYSHYRWQLRTTSQGVLLIASLLTPLNFLAIAAFNRSIDTPGPLTIAGEICSIALFAGLTYAAGRVLAERLKIWYAVGLVAPSIVQLLVRRWVTPASSEGLLLTLGSLPLLIYAVVNAAPAWRTRRSTELGASHAAVTLMLLGVSTFATLLPLGLLASKTGHPLEMAHPLAALFSGLAVTPLAIGLSLWRRCVGQESLRLRVASLSVAIIGAGLLLLGVALAWPDPISLLPTALMSVVILTAVAIWLQLPEAHWPAACCAALAYLLMGQLVTGRIGWRDVESRHLINDLLSGRSGQLLLFLAIIFAACALIFERLKRPQDRRAFVGSAGATALVSLALVSWFGLGVPGDPLHATWIFAGYAVLSFLAAERGQSVAANMITVILLLAVCIQGLLFALVEHRFIMPLVTALAVHATILTALVIFKMRRQQSPVTAGDLIYFWSALCSSAVAAGVLTFTTATSDTHLQGGYWLWLGLLWLTLSLLTKRSSLFALFQTALVISVGHFVASWLQRQSWYLLAAEQLLDPRVWQAEALACAALGLAWSGVRVLCRQSATMSPPNGVAATAVGPTGWRTLLEPPGIAIDRLATRLSLTVLIGLSIYAAWPGTAAELDGIGLGSIKNYELLNTPHLPAQGAGSWWLLAMLLTAMLAEMFQRRILPLAVWLLPIAWCAVLLGSSRWEAQSAVASATAWFGTLFLFGGSAAIWCRNSLYRAGPWRTWPAVSSGAVEVSIAITILLGTIPTLAIAGFVFGASPLELSAGPVSTSIFARLAPAMNYGLPVLLAALAIVGHAIRQRSVGMALLGGFVGNVAVTIIHFLHAGVDAAHFNSALRIERMQLNAIWSAAFGLIWIGLGIWQRQFTSPMARKTSWALRAQFFIPTALNLLILLPAWLMLVLDPTAVRQLAAAANALGCLAVVLTLFGVLTISGRVALPRSSNACLLGSWVVVTLLACASAHWDIGNWLAFHVLLIGHVATAWLLALQGWWRESRERSGLAADRNATVLASLTAACVVILLAFRAEMDDPHGPAWTIAALAAMSALAAWLAWFAGRRGLLYFTAQGVCLAVTVGWMHANTVGLWQLDFDAAMELLEVNLVALAAPALVWSWLERAVARRALTLTNAATLPIEPPRGFITDSKFPSLTRFVTALAIAALSCLIAIYLFHGLIEQPIAGPRVWEWLAVASTVFAAAVCLWDASARDAVLGLYVLGLAVCAATLEQWAHGFHQQLWLGNTLLAAYALLTSYLWSRRAGLRAIAESLKISTDRWNSMTWLTPLNGLLAVCVILLSLNIELTFAEFALRVLAAKCIVFQMATLGLLARGERRSYLQYASLGVGVIGAVALGWACLTPGVDDSLLNRSTVLVAALAAMAIVYGLGLGKLLAAESEWLGAALRLIPILIVGCCMAIALVLCQEIWLSAQSATFVMDSWALAIIAIALAAQASAALAAAVLPGRDPLRLSERGRMNYVYASEVLFAVLMLHIRLTMPWLFHGFFARYWPIIAMVMAFVWVGVGQGLRRRWRVLGEPLETTGALLPIAPLVGCWLLPLGVDYSLLLLAACALYASLAAARKSFGYGVISVLAANAALWFFLGRQENHRLLDHPQFWLIPPALCVLAAAQLMRKQLTAAQLASVRYGAATVAYVASTADIFIQGVANSPWLPIVLAGLSLAGVAAGIALRVRAFLILGTSFLLLSLLTVIWYAAVDLHQTWLWAVTGIVAGVMIVVVFAVFEKQRQKVHDVLENIKDWQ